ncbi:MULTISPECIES: XkdQ/YqbQ family protein [Fusobacterium]|uniref:XkdQ/YqbQ family protein n=1 Tax=Fusobacterium TaxID=848 RepID=UPI00201AEB23|nr:terminase [Fusobacterium nucleatum]MCL4584218.1 terminase [Fusobacterium nucleatum YWH7055]DAN17386.1 MAG TPA: 43 kDa tail protein [Caudoviricetes sp.]
MYKVIIKDKDVSDIIGNLTWRDTVDTLGVEVEFELPVNRYDKDFEFLYDITLGDPIQILNDKGETLVQAIIVTETPNGKITNFTAYDMAWYLNKSTVIKQFKKMIGNDCVKSLCKEIGIKVEVSGLDTKIDKIYKDKSISDVIKDIIEQCSQFNSKKFFIEFDNGTLKIMPYKKITVFGQFEIQKDKFININENIGGVSLTKSIVDMKNSVLVITENKGAVRTIGQEQDTKSIEKYGKLQQVVTLDEKEFSKANLVAKNELKKLNRITEDFGIDVLGDDKVKSGRVIDIDLPLFNLKGEYLIKESNHTISNNIHRINLKLEGYSDE